MKNINLYIQEKLIISRDVERRYTDSSYVFDILKYFKYDSKFGENEVNQINKYLNDWFDTKKTLVYLCRTDIKKLPEDLISKAYKTLLKKDFEELRKKIQENKIYSYRGERNVLIMYCDDQSLSIYMYDDTGGKIDMLFNIIVKK